MISNSLALSGVSIISKNTGDKAMALVLDNIQTLHTEVDYGSYPAVQVKAGIPVKWTIVVPEGKLNGCNGEIIIPAFDIDIVLHEGNNVLEFTAKEAGIFPYSCWMGMIKSTNEVTE